MHMNSTPIENSTAKWVTYPNNDFHALLVDGNELILARISSVSATQHGYKILWTQPNTSEGPFLTRAAAMAHVIKQLPALGVDHCDHGCGT
jgi:hypothetical protein